MAQFCIQGNSCVPKEALLLDQEDVAEYSKWVWHGIQDVVD